MLVGVRNKARLYDSLLEALKDEVEKLRERESNARTEAKVMRAEGFDRAEVAFAQAGDFAYEAKVLQAIIDQHEQGVDRG